MKKVVWICFFGSLVLVNGLAILADMVWGVYIAIPYRLVVVLALSFISMIFAGAWMLVKGAEKDKR
jgi:hypothetical protein